jgi:oligopeptide transport system permease protein
MKAISFFKFVSMLFLALILICFCISYQKATAVNLDFQNKAPSFAHLLGTDELGRDVLARCLYGLKMSLMIGIAATFVDMILGSFFGIACALFKEPYRSFFSRFLDVMTILPQMLLSLLVLMIVRDGFYSLIIAISLTGWLPTARAMRSEMLRLKHMDFVLSLKGLGFSYFTILMKHLLPCALPTLIISTALCLPASIFSEAFMSFLGLGVAPPTPSLGNMIADGLPALAYFPWRLLAPASVVFLFITYLLTAIELLKKRLREASL